MMISSGWLVFLFLFSSLATSYIIRLILPGIASIPWSPVSMLDEWNQLQYETESYVFIASVILFLVLYIVGVALEPLLRNKIPGLTSVTRSATFGISLAIIIQPFHQFLIPANTLTLVITCIAGACFLIVEKYVNRRQLLETVTWGILAVLLAKICLPIFIRFDSGINPALLTKDYFPMGLTALGAWTIWLLTKKTLLAKKLRSHWTKPVIAMALLLFITIMLLRLMTIVLPSGNTNYDIYLLVSPAYSLIKGATPFVDFMSMYGVLSLLPWIIWLFLFPTLPVSPAMSIVVTTLSVIVYFAAFIFITGKIINRTIIWVLVVLCVFYYAFMIRVYVPGDMASLLSFPATTPLRFGMFLVPLWSLIKYVKTGNKITLRWLLVSSIVLLLFSFEMGVGWLASAVAATVFSVFTIKRSFRMRDFRNLSGFFFTSLILFVVAIIYIVYLRTGKMPDLASYTFYPRFFGTSGYYMLPIGTETAHWVHILTSALSFIIGLYYILWKGDRRGLLFAYLSLIQITMIPYYMGRSLFQTLFTITLPTVILWGMILNDALDQYILVRKNIAAIAVVLLISLGLYFGSWRTIYQSVALWKQPATHAINIINFARDAVSFWHVKQTPQYSFLKNHLPAGCPLVSFDSLEYELTPALGVRPALNYPQLRYMVITEGQIDSFISNYRNGFYCLFMNKNEYEQIVTYGIYEYYWLTIRDKATMIAQDPTLGFELYAIHKN